MATVTEPDLTTWADHMPYAITSDVYFDVVERGLIPAGRRVFLWAGRLYEKMAESKAHAAVQNAFLQGLSQRLPPGLFVGAENPVRLDANHVPLPDLIVVRGSPLDYFDTRFPEGRDVLLVVEVSVSSLPEDLRARLARYARALPVAAYVVADVGHRQILVHTGPRASNDPAGAGYQECTVVRPGETLQLRLDDVALEPIPYEALMR